MEKQDSDSPSSKVDDYNAGNAWLYKALGEHEASVRDCMSHDVFGRVLEVGCGTGLSGRALLSYAKSLVVTDVVPEFVNEAKRLLNVEGQVCDVHALPFADESFDCVFHFGAFNTFNEPAQALAELHRVAKYKVVFGDEGIAPWLRGTLYGRILVRANPLYLNTPPLHLLPEGAQRVELRWLLGNAFWLISYVKGIPPELDLDLTIPGKRGGTLRSRFYG